jgi:P27 family predicted phage terminase small subunit
MPKRGGRPPKPVELKVIEGNRGKRKITEPPKAPPSRPQCPSWLSDYAKTEWRYIVPILDELGLLTKLDRPALAMLCDALGLFRRGVEELNQSKTLMVKSGNRVSKHPLIQVVRDARRDADAILGSFGMTPADRVRLLGEAQTHSGGAGRLSTILSAEA